MPLGVDVGGTFTDAVFWDGQRLRVGKTSTTTTDQSEGLVAAADVAVGGDSVGQFVHGTTVATNALLERRGAETMLVTNPGFEHLIEIGRQDRPSLYDSNDDRTAAIVTRRNRVAIADDWESDLDRVVAECEAAGAEAVLVGFVNAYLDDRAERAVSDALRARLGIPVFSSTGVSHEFREYERLATGTVNAFLAPEVDRYLTRLRERSERQGLPTGIAVMRSSGGLVSLKQAIELPVAILLSGPAGGVVASAVFGDLLGLDTLVSFDMGGTSTDVCLIEDAQPRLAYQKIVAGHPIVMPSIAIHTVGAGGGSIGWADAGGALRVGPQSAGARPGPASYGRGGHLPTVTDANVFLRRIDPAGRLADSVELHFDRAHEALAELGAGLGLDPTETAEGLLRVVESHMSHAIGAVSLHQGTDPRSAHLMAFGGAGGLHAVALAQTLEMAGVVVPPFAGVFSALGLLLSPPRVDLSATIVPGADEFGAALDEAARLADMGAARMTAETGASPNSVTLVADMRYRGQSHETSVPMALMEGFEDLVARFHELHSRRNGFARTDDPIEIVTVRAEVVGQPALSRSELPNWHPHGEPGRGHRIVHGAHGEERAEVWWRPGLAPGTEITGPAVVEESEATTYLPVGTHTVVHDSGAMMIEW